MPKFEAHITMPRDQKALVEKVGEATKWSFSAIDGDPLMGKTPYCYLTNYAPHGKMLMKDMQQVVVKLKEEGVEVLRTKVERIVFDSKTGWNEIGL